MAASLICAAAALPRAAAHRSFRSSLFGPPDPGPVLAEEQISALVTGLLQPGEPNAPQLMRLTRIQHNFAYVSGL